MKKITKSSIVTGGLLLVVLGLAIWRMNAYEIVGPTRLYETATNRVFVFKKKEDRIAYHLSAILFGNQLDGAEKVRGTAYTGRSKPITDIITSEQPSEFEYTFQGEIVEVDGLRYPMIKGTGGKFKIDAGKRYVLVLRQSVTQTDYQLLTGISLSVLSGEANETSLEFLEVTEAEIEELYNEE